MQTQIRINNSKNKVEVLHGCGILIQVSLSAIAKHKGIFKQHENYAGSHSKDYLTVFFNCSKDYKQLFCKLQKAKGQLHEIYSKNYLNFVVRIVQYAILNSATKLLTKLEQSEQAFF
jgi:hypothetical protein